MLDLRVEETPQTPNQMEDKLHHPKKNLPAQRKKAVIMVNGNHAEATITVWKQAGIHARPSSIMVQTAAKFKSKIQLQAKGRSIDAKSILMVMGSGLVKDTEVKFCADGPDAEEAVKALAELIESGFGEETC